MISHVITVITFSLIRIHGLKHLEPETFRLRCFPAALLCMLFGVFIFLCLL